MILGSEGFPITSIGEQKANILGSVPMARRANRDEAEILSQKDLNELRHNLAHLSIQAVRDFYDQANGDCPADLPSASESETDADARAGLEAALEVAMI
jgi:hypothetical protein